LLNWFDNLLDNRLYGVSGASEIAIGQGESNVSFVDIVPCAALYTAMLSHPAVSLSEFSSHVARLKSGDGRLFSREYESIDPGQQFTWDASNEQENKTKNRYANVIAYDHSRVKLDAFNEALPSSDYINANFIDGYCRPNAYIATQVSP